MRNRNTKIAVLILVGLILFTAMGFIVIRYSASQGQIAEDERLIQDLGNELQQMEENMVEMRVLFEDQGLQVSEANQLLQEKSEMLDYMERELSRLKAEGKINKQKIRELEKALENARNRVLVQQQSVQLKKLSEERDLLVARLDSVSNGLIDASQAAEMERLNQQLKEENGKLRGRLYEMELEQEEVTSLQAANFSFYSIKSGKRSQFYNNFLKATDIKEIDFCFDLLKNARIEGFKDLYMQIQSPHGIFYTNFDGYSKELQVGGQIKVFTAATSVNYKRKAKEVCINFRPSDSKPFVSGIQVIYVYADGKIIGKTNLELK